MCDFVRLSLVEGESTSRFARGRHGLPCRSSKACRVKQKRPRERDSRIRGVPYDEHSTSVDSARAHPLSGARDARVERLVVLGYLEDLETCLTFQTLSAAVFRVLSGGMEEQMQLTRWTIMPRQWRSRE